MFFFFPNLGIRFTRCVGLESLPELCACAVKVINEVKRSFSDSNNNNNNNNKNNNYNNNNNNNNNTINYIDRYDIELLGGNNSNISGKEKEREKEKEKERETNKFMHKSLGSDSNKEREVEKEVVVSSSQRVLSFAAKSLKGGLPLIEAR